MGGYSQYPPKFLAEFKWEYHFNFNLHVPLPIKHIDC